MAQTDSLRKMQEQASPDPKKIAPFTPHAGERGDDGGMNSETVRVIEPPEAPPPSLGRPWTMRDCFCVRLTYTIAHDQRTEPIDWAVLGRLYETQGFQLFQLTLDVVEDLRADLRHWGQRATTNKLALSLKRLARTGYLSAVTPEIYALGIEEKRIPRALRAQILARDGRSCRACGSSDALHVDHIVARSRGGETTPDNLQVLCRPCNLQKGAS